MSQDILNIDRLITDREVAVYYGVGRQTVWTWVGKGLIPGPVVNRHRFTRWSLNQVQKSIASMKEQQKQEAAS